MNSSIQTNVLTISVFFSAMNHNYFFFQKQSATFQNIVAYMACQIQNLLLLLLLGGFKALYNC